MLWGLGLAPGPIDLPGWVGWGVAVAVGRVTAAEGAGTVAAPAEWGLAGAVAKGLGGAVGWGAAAVGVVAAAGTPAWVGEEGTKTPLPSPLPY